MACPSRVFVLRGDYCKLRHRGFIPYREAVFEKRGAIGFRPYSLKHGRLQKNRLQPCSLWFPPSHVRGVLRGFLGKRRMGEILELGPKGDMVAYNMVGLYNVSPCDVGAFVEGKCRVMPQHNRFCIHDDDIPRRKLACESPWDTEPSPLCDVKHERIFQRVFWLALP